MRRESSDSSGFDRLIYERVRLGIMSALAMNEQLTFNELKSLFNASDGNLSAHARKLEEAGYVACTKSFEARRPKSHLPHHGRSAKRRCFAISSTSRPSSRRHGASDQCTSPSSWTETAAGPPQRGLPRTAGHVEGAKAVRTAVEVAARADVETLTSTPSHPPIGRARRRRSRR